jgi:hypothetical protein
LISDASFCGHSGQNRHAHVDVVVDNHLTLRVVETVQPAGILGKRTFPRDRHGKEKRIEAGIIETLAEIAPGRDNDAFLGLGNRGETRGDVVSGVLPIDSFVNLLSSLDFR